MQDRYRKKNAACRLSKSRPWRSVLNVLIAFAMLMALARAVKAFEDASAKIAELTRSAKYAEALSLSELQVARVRAEIGEENIDYAKALAWQAYLLQVQSQLAKAEPVFKRSLEIYERVLPAGHPDIATAINNLGFYYQISDKLIEAETLYKRALDMREKALPANDPAIADSLNNLAQVYKHEGRTEQALPLLKRSLEIRAKNLKPNDPLIAQSLTNIGAALERLGNFPDAEPFFRKTLEIRIASQPPGHPEIAGAYNKLAQNLSSQGKLADAETLFQEALKLRSQVLDADSLDIADSLQDRAQNLFAMKRFADAEGLLVRSLEIRTKMLPPTHPNIAHAQSDLASVTLAQDRPEEALEHIRQGLKILQARAKMDDLGKQRFAEFVKIAWRAREKLTDAPAANQLVDEALSNAQRATASPTSVAVARMAARFSASDDGLRQLVRERDTWEGRQSQLETDLSAALSLPEAKRKIPVSVLRQEIEEATNSITQSDAKLKNQFPKYAALVSPAPLSTSEIQKLLGADEVLLNYVSTPEEMYVWAVTHDASDWQRLEVNPAQLSSSIAQLRDTLDLQTLASRSAKSELFDLGLAHDLYQQVLAPVETAMAGKSRIIVVANGALTSLPIQLLVKSKPAIAKPKLEQLAAYRDADWVARHYAVSVLPSVTSLSSLREIVRKSRSEAPMVGFANPVLGGEMQTAMLTDRSIKADAKVDKASPPSATARGYAQFWRGPAADLDALRNGLPPLPETETELKEVARNLKAADRDLMFGTSATETAVKTAKLSKYGIVYFATHGLVAGEVHGLGEPALVFSLPKVPTDVDDGLLTASEVTQLSLDADWVVLSACNTAAGDHPGAEALSGLARAFFHAGARAMLVSHWRVGSEAAAALTTQTFAALEKEPGIGRAEAVRRAMTALIDDVKDPWNAYPAFWAPFTVVGEGRR